MSSSSSSRSSPMLTPYSSPMLTLATYSQPHRPSSPSAHFHIEREAERVPPSIKRRTSSTPSLSRSTSSSSSTMGSPHNFGIRSLPVVLDEVEIVNDTDEDYHSDVSTFELQPTKSPAANARPVRPKLQRRDTPIPPITSLPADKSPLQRPSTAFRSNLRTEPDNRVFTWTRKRRDTPRPVARPEWLSSLSNEMIEEWRNTDVFEKPRQQQEKPQRKGSWKSVTTGNMWIEA